MIMAYTTTAPTALNYATPTKKQTLVTEAPIATTPGYETDYIVATRLVKMSPPQVSAANANDFTEVGYVNQENTFVSSVSEWIKGSTTSEQVSFVRKAANYTGYIDDSCVPLGKRGELSRKQESWVKN